MTITITIPDKIIKDKDVYDFIRVNCQNWLTEAKQFFESKDVFSRNGWRWHYDSSTKKVYASKNLLLLGLINTGFIAKLTYNGKRFNVKIVE